MLLSERAEITEDDIEMVPTRGSSIKFADGERVLSYEPDPTMAKVLYESKILEYVPGRDKKGKKVIEYRIHFNGWNSSYDRCVPEEFILADTDENRTLQKRLLEEATVNLKNRIKCKSKERYLGRKRKLKEFSEDENDSISDKVFRGNVFRKIPVPQSLTSDTSSSEEDKSDDEKKEFDIDIEIPSCLKTVLISDREQIKNQKVLKLPCKQNVITIMESFVKSFSVNLLCNTEKSRTSTVNEDVTSKIRICKEVIDGLRVYFDFMLPELLLYNEEQAQYKGLIKSFKKQLELRNKLNKERKKLNNNQENGDLKKIAKVDENNKHSEKQASSLNKSKSKTVNKGSSRKKRSRPCSSRTDSSDPENRKAIQEPRPKKIVRRLRSSSGSQMDSEPLVSFPIPPKRVFRRRSSSKTDESKMSFNPIKTENIKLEIITDEICQKEEVEYTNPADTSSSAATTSIDPYATSSQQKIDEILAWKFIPDESLDIYAVMPSVMYGAVHLLRMFVKLPILLQKTDISENKMDVILKYVEEFLLYLNDRKDDLYSTEVYTDTPERFPDTYPS